MRYNCRNNKTIKYLDNSIHLEFTLQIILLWQKLRIVHATVTSWTQLNCSSEHVHARERSRRTNSCRFVFKIKYLFSLLFDSECTHKNSCFSDKSNTTLVRLTYGYIECIIVLITASSSSSSSSGRSRIACRLMQLTRWVRCSCQ